MPVNTKKTLTTLSTDHLFEHSCHCGKWGSFGYGFFPRDNRRGTWYCREHIPAAKPSEMPWEPEDVIVEPEPILDEPDQGDLFGP